MTADLSLVPDSYSVEADSYKFTSVCSATFDAVYDANGNRYSNKYAAATILAIGLLFSVYVAGGKTRRLCTGNKESTNDEENDFVEMNKIDDDADMMEIESEVSVSPSNGKVQKEKGQAKRLFPDFFRRQTKSKPTIEGANSISTVSHTAIDQRNAFVAL